MKKSLLALAALTAFAGAASAQSSVTLFGVIDQSVNQVKNGSTTTTTLQSNQLNSNRLGFRGTEDIGGGIKAGFWLEAGMTNENGGVGGSNGQAAANAPAFAYNGANGSSFFNRRSTVSLYSALGEVRLGRDYTPTFWNLVYDDVNGANGLGQGLNLVSTLGSNAITLARTNNSVGYFLPAGIGGVYGQGMIALGEGVPGQKYYGMRLGWASGPIDINGSYSQTKTEIFGDDFEVLSLGGSWDFNFLKVYFFWNETKFGGANQDVYDLSASVPIGPGQLRGVVASAKASGISSRGQNFDGQKATLYSIEYVYDISKRTSLYTTYAYIDNKDGAAFKVLGTAGNSLNDKSQGFNIGVRHSF